MHKVSGMKKEFGTRFHLIPGCFGNTTATFRSIIGFLILLTQIRASGAGFNFSQQIPIADGMPDSYYFKQGDLNGDGRMDIVVSDSAGARFFWFERKATVDPNILTTALMCLMELASRLSFRTRS